jgi:hypothetical protein
MSVEQHADADVEKRKVSLATPDVELYMCHEPMPSTNAQGARHGGHAHRQREQRDGSVRE